MSVNFLDPLRFPLHGSRLVEASAGTGKTFTIAALYVRLVLGHGGEAAFTRPMTPPEILVVTFTDAATKELRDRIRDRLRQATNHFRSDASVETSGGDELLDALRDEIPFEQWPACARLLQLATERMDEAAVSTIHGWCYRMLTEHAFDSNSLFTQTLVSDQSPLLAEAVRDYWRSFFNVLAPGYAARVRGWWASPEVLQKLLKPLLPLAVGSTSAIEPARALAESQAACEKALAELQAPWSVWVEELQALLDQAVDQKLVHGTKLQRRHFQPWLDELRAWAQRPASELAGGEPAPWAVKSTAWKRLTPEGLAEVWKDGPAPDHPALEAIRLLPAQLAALPDGYQAVVQHAVLWVRQRFADEQTRLAQMGFNDVLTRLEAALYGPNGAQLAERIRTQFPVALIDEFQDTDPVQYRIFDAIYRVAENRPDLALVLIGDPKQAIYKFRGADIFTYLQARASTEGRHYTLGKNFRSTADMVRAVNHLFDHAESAPQGAGAFLFREQGADNPVPFVAVDAHGRKDQLVVEGEHTAALNCWVLPAEGTLSSGPYVAQMSAVCASEITRLLSLGQQGRAGFDEPGKPRRPLRPGDMAVLVNSGREARALRQQLARRGVRSVYLSDQESVYQTAQAAELQHWLAACAEPDNGRLLRAALGTTAIGQSWAALDELNHDDLAWEQVVLQFHGYRQVWRQWGVLPMLRRLMTDFDVPQRLLAAQNERALTDFLHLAELMQQAGVLLDGEHALIRYLAEQREATEGEDEAGRMRLESDAALLKVVTVHKSKGLEYPLVFLPFVCAFRAVKPTDSPLSWHDAEGKLHVALEPDAIAVQLADQERLGEDLRKLYVATTRARYATWLGMAPLKELGQSAIGYLLSPGQHLAPEAVGAALDDLAVGCAAMQVAAAPPVAEILYAQDTALAPLQAERSLQRTPQVPWWIASYSALHLGSPVLAEDLPEDSPALAQPVLARASDSADFEAYAQSQEPAAPDQQLVLAGVAPESAGLHTFPRGAGPGSFLHGLLEWVAGNGFQASLNAPEDLTKTVETRAQSHGWSEWAPVLNNWLVAALTTALPLGGETQVSLAELGAGQFQVEMEFWFAVFEVDTLQLDQQITQHTLDGATRPALLRNQLNGMLKGYMDLVFAHEGRYYVLDYKSNWLGADDAAYTPEALRQAVLKNRYEVQYVLYVFALHRLLKSRLPHYQYEEHVGGAVTWFLRGQGADTRGVHLERPPFVLIEALEALFSAPVAEGAV
jgi:exodeoxyribonuclease V beta subunit